MNNAIKRMLEKYNCKNPEDFKNALKEIIQEITLLGLSRAKFYEHAAFYGGTALRILYVIDRFSEDLDFSLIKPNSSFDISYYCKFVSDELTAYGFKVNVEKKLKRKQSQIESAFIKANTLIHLLQIEGLNNPESGTDKNEKFKVKFEVDINPPPFAEYEVKYILNPIPFSVKSYDLPSMFAGKLHAFLCRNPQSIRIKGRDLYDVIWFISNGIEVNLKHFEARMKQTRHFEKDSILNNKIVNNLILDKINSLDIKQAKNDILPFVKDPFSVDVWSKDFFVTVFSKITFV